MHNLKIIKGKEKKSYKPTKEHYKRAFLWLIAHYPANGQGVDFIKKFIYISVKLYPLLERKGLTMEELDERLQFMFTVTDLMGNLTPVEFIKLFPIQKNYNGERYGMKDYYSTLEEVKKYPPDVPIGIDNIQNFLMEYMNKDIFEFEIAKLILTSDIRKMQGQPGIMEEFAAGMGITTYTHYQEEGIMVENGTGKVIKVSKPRKRVPRYLRVVN